MSGEPTPLQLTDLLILQLDKYVPGEPNNEATLGFLREEIRKLNYLFDHDAEVRRYLDVLKGHVFELEHAYNKRLSEEVRSNEIARAARDAALLISLELRRIIANGAVD